MLNSGMMAAELVNKSQCSQNNAVTEDVTMQIWQLSWLILQDRWKIKQCCYKYNELELFSQTNYR